MRRMRLLVIGGLLALAVSLVGAIAAGHHGRSLRLARGRLIDAFHWNDLQVEINLSGLGRREGVGRREVEAMLGGPPGDFTTTPVTFFDDSYSRESPDLSRCQVWAGDHGLIAVEFDENGKATSASFLPGAPRQPASFAEWLRDALRPLWP